MLEIILLLAALSVVAPVGATKRRRSARSRIIVVRVHVTLPLGALADNTVILANMFADSVEGNDLYMISADLVVALKNATASQGPILFGVAHDDYSVTEIAECIQADNLDLSDKIQVERARRQVREWGFFSVANTEEVVNNGNLKRYKIKILSELGHNLSFWAMNLSDASLTTGAIIDVTGKAYVRRT